MTEPVGDLVSAWALALAGTGPRLAELLGALSDDEILAHKTGASVGGALIDAHFAQPTSLSATLVVLDEYPPAQLSPKTLSVLRAGVAAGFAEALRERTRGEQEAIHRAALSAYRTGEARFRTVFTNAALGIGVADRNGRILEINGRLADMLGIEAHAARGRNIRDLRQTSDPPEYWQAHEELFSGERAQYSSDKQFNRGDGSVTWTHMRANTVQDEQGAVQLLISLFEDITERRQMNDRLVHQATPDPGPRPASGSGCASWTSTGSRGSTTPSATRPGTGCWRRSPGGSRTSPSPGTWWRVWAATSSSCCCRRPTGPRTSSPSPRPSSPRSAGRWSSTGAT